MKKSVLRNCVSAAAVAAAGLFTVPAFAQSAPAPAAAENATEADALDAIVVTASLGDKSKINSSVSVTTVDAKIINDFHPSAEAEVFRLIPGIQVAGTAGPGGNSNIAVRGLPVATGGSPFVQIQEDGLPTVLFGDIQFGNNDYWTHYDATVASVESLRGGTAATHASQAPGAVINYISKTGKTEGGYVELQEGVNYQENKFNLVYGSHINDSTYYNIGGYFKSGRGPLHAGYNVSDSFQVKGNLTKEFDGGNGFLRLLFKVADTHEPNYTGSPALATVSGGKISNIKPYPGFDGRTQSNYSIYNQTFQIVNRDGVLERVKMDGISTKATSIGAQFHYEFSPVVTVDNNVRWSTMSGSFASPFLNVSKTNNTAVVPAGFTACTAPSTYSANGVIGSCVNGQIVTAIKYASGPNAGNAYTGKYLDNNVNVRTNIRDLGSFTDDFGVSAKINVGTDSKLTAHAGWFVMNQKIAMDWHVNKSLRELSGANPSQLDIYAGANQLSVAGQYGFNNNWGNCCARDYELSYTDNAPNVSLDLDTPLFGIDGSVRFDSVKASGSGRASSGTTYNTVVGGVSIPTFLADDKAEVLNYTRSYTSWTIGGLIHANRDTTVFARASRGGRFNSDRQTLGGKFTNAGLLCTGAQAKAASNGCGADGVTPSVDFVTQYELGLKNRGNLAGGHYSVELTLLNGNFKQSTFELSATKCPGTTGGGCVIDAKYKTSGAELYATYRNGGFSFYLNATYTKAKQLDSGATAYRRADNIPDLSYTAGANYDVGDFASLGLNLTGVTSELNGGNVYPGGTTFGANVKIMPIKNLELGMNIYNLFDTFDLRGAGGVTDAGVTPAIIGGAPVLGRTFTASVKYKF
ncbi:MAG: TonB-dependent receptor domain-containing protein [Novosphingobium sp.]